MANLGPLLVCLSFIFLIIGMPTYIMGCNTTMYPAGCVGYSPEHAVVKSTGTSKSTCCWLYTTVNKVQQCAVWQSCWYGVVNFDTCRYEDAKSWDDEHSASTSIAEQYRLGDSFMVFRSRSDMNKCTINSTQVQTALPIVGAVFLSLSAVMMVLMCCICACQRNETKLIHRNPQNPQYQV